MAIGDVESVTGMQGVTYVDTGMYDTTGYGAVYVVDAERPALVETGIGANRERVLDLIAATGLSPADIEVIAVTHVHLDHAGGAGFLAADCPDATVYAHETGAPHLVDPTRLWEGTKAAVGGQIEYYVEPRPVPGERVVELEDGEEIDLSDRLLRAHHAPGHAPHQVVFEYPAAAAVFVGDAAGLYVPERDSAYPTSPPPNFDLEAPHRRRRKRTIPRPCSPATPTASGRGLTTSSESGKNSATRRRSSSTSSRSRTWTRSGAKRKPATRRRSTCGACCTRWTGDGVAGLPRKRHADTPEVRRRRAAARPGERVFERRSAGVEYADPVAREHPIRVEVAELSPWREQAKHRVDAESLPLRPEVLGGPHGLRNDERLPVEQRTLLPEPAIEDALRPVGGVPERPREALGRRVESTGDAVHPRRDVHRDVVTAGDRGRVALVAIQQRRDSRYRSRLREVVVESLEVDRIDDPHRVALSERVARPLHPLFGVCDPGEPAVPLRQVRISPHAGLLHGHVRVVVREGIKRVVRRVAPPGAT
jgi:glyoxylase-like metal-dependent hydrolase (beta-lactamase superfamily II)